MHSKEISGLFLSLILIVQCEGKAEIGDYIVDCSACNYLPLTKMDSYQCNVRCDVQTDNGEASVNLTTLYDIVTELSDELAEMKKKLNTNVAFSAELEGDVSFNGGEKIIFTKVPTNIGNGYDNTTGIFTAPHNVTYLFTLISMITTGDHTALITLNEERLRPSYGFGGYRPATTTLNKQLVVGDQVWVKTKLADTYGEGFNFFSGNIIRV